MLKVGNNKCQYSLYAHIGVQENEKNERPTGTAPDRQSDYVGACRSLDTVSSLYLSVSRTKHLEPRQRKAGGLKKLGGNRHEASPGDAVYSGPL